LAATGIKLDLELEVIGNQIWKKKY
jgi:hypothetical protein